MFTLEKYKGPGTRHTCPSCGRAKKFTRYIDSETLRYLADHVGRCDRESSCGYHYRPKNYFADNEPVFDRNYRFSKYERRPKGRSIQKPGRKGESSLDRGDDGHFQMEKPDFIEIAILIDSLRDYDRNRFVLFLRELFKHDPSVVWRAIRDYLIGTNKDGKTVFWQVDQERRIRTGKIIDYDSSTGKRRKDAAPAWIHTDLKKAGLLKQEFELKQCFFGEHLLSKYPDLPIAIVESEKSAVIGSICKGVFPDMIWLACGGKSNLSADRLARLGTNREIILNPDAGGFEKWQSIAVEARTRGQLVMVSDLIETRATEAEKVAGYDLADYLIREQTRRNDPVIREAFRDLIEERLAIMTIDGEMEEEVAESMILRSGFYKETIGKVLAIWEQTLKRDRYEG